MVLEQEMYEMDDFEKKKKNGSKGKILLKISVFWNNTLARMQVFFGVLPYMLQWSKNVKFCKYELYFCYYYVTMCFCYVLVM